MTKQSIAAIILIAVGLLLFLEQLDLIYLSGGDYLVYGSIIGGILWFFNGANRIDKKGILAGTFFFSFGIILWLMRNYYYLRSDELIVAGFFISLALANLVYFLFKLSSTNNVIFAVIFGVLGGGFLFAYLDYYPLYRFFYQIEHYWPMVLIIFGLVLLYKGLRRRDSISAEQNSV
jgi:hypothetical protein